VRGATALLLALALGATGAAAAQTISVSSVCRPQGGAGDYPVGDPIQFRYEGPLPGLPKDGLTVVPPCVPVELAADVSGKPPLTLTWEGPGGFTASGNPVVVDTGVLPAGEQSIVLTVANAYGEATAAVSLAVAQLAPIPRAPVPDEAPSADLEATFTITAFGAYEWRWDFGDGTTTPWLAPQCAFETSTVTHTFPASGTYQVTATARNCRDGKQTSRPLAISVGDPNVIELLTFEAQGCDAGFCIFNRGEPITFTVETNATPDRYLWDWDGNGTVDEVTVAPVSHAYEDFGIFTPRVTVERGSGSDSLVHGQYILVN
jgi:hypothetical protein